MLCYDSATSNHTFQVLPPICVIYRISYNLTKSLKKGSNKNSSIKNKKLYN